MDMKNEITDKIKQYAQEKKLDGSIYLIGSSIKKEESGEIDLLFILNDDYRKRLEIQKDLIDVLNEEEIFDYSRVKNYLPNKKEQVHILIYNKMGDFNDNPIFTREYFLDGFELLYGEDVSEELMDYLDNKITAKEYLGYLNFGLFELETLILSADTYPDPKKEIKERIKIVNKCLEVIERDLGYKLNIQKGKSPEEFAIKAYEFLSETKKRIKIDNFLKIREIKKEDLPKIKAYFNNFKTEYPYVPRKSSITNEEIDDWSNAIESKESYAMVAELSDEVLGVCALNKMPLDDFYRISVTLLPEYTSFGIGKKIIESTIELGKHKNIKSIIDDTHIDNTPMNSILEKSGFVNLTTAKQKPIYYDELVNFYKKNFDEALYDNEYHIWKLDF